MTFTPIHYDLTIKTSFPDSFSGTLEIAIDIGASATSLSLNTAQPLLLLGAVLVAASDRFSPTRINVDAENQLTTLEFGAPLPEGSGVLGLVWTGRLDEGSSLGYYRFSPAGDDEYCAVTQFQPSLARRAFPCVDHPINKATFQISLISPSAVVSLANTPEESRTSSDGLFTPTAVLTAEFLDGVMKETKVKKDWELIRFKKTPKMSTYLIAWAVGKFSSTSASYTSPLTRSTIKLSVYASKASQSIERGLADLALDTLAKVMPLYETMFEIPYAIEKLDILACEEFDAGAMENYGLITGRTAMLLHDSSQNSLSALFRTVATIGHEAAHQWFGDAVTPAWWDGLWLNEGFATLMGEVIVLKEIYPKWHVHSTFIKFHRTAALELDALRSSHPVVMDCPDDFDTTVSQSFDAISYEKGSALLKMLSNFIGQDTFIKATSNYLKAHLYSNTTSNDLWKSMSEASGFDVADLMLNWTTKVGFPVVVVEEVPTGLHLRQARFLGAGNASPEEDATIWKIPLDIQIAGDSRSSRKPTIMSTRELDILMASESLYVLNSNSSGTYRVSYPVEHLVRLGAEAGKVDSKLSVADRLGILQDVFLLAEAGYTKTSSALAFLKTIANEPEFFVWAEVASSLSRLRDVWWEQGTEVLASINAFGRSLFGPLAARLGFSHAPEDDTDTRVFRVLAISSAAASEDPAVLAHLKTSFALLASGQADPTSADLTLTIVREAVKHGGDMEFQMAMAIYMSPPTPQHQVAAIAGLTATRSPVHVQQAAAMLMDGQVSDQNMQHFITGFSANPVSRRLVWQFVQAAWPLLEQKLAGSMNFGTVVRYSFQMLTSQEDATAVQAFFADKDTTAFRQGLDQGVETVQAKARWLERDSEDVNIWLRQNGFMPS